MNIDLKKLGGQYVYLELLQEDHIETLRQLARNETIWEYTKGILVNEAYNKNFDEYIALALNKNALGGQQAFVIRQTTDNAVIGMTRLYDINPKDKKLAIGYTWYVPAIWGKAHNKECKLLLLQYVFEACAVTRVEFHVAGENLRSQKAVEKVGGVKEGILRKHNYRHGQVRDMVMFSIIDDEWPVKKEKLIMLMAANENR
ncbi:MAG: GNAT family protein [Chitinophagaceae bacterium]